MFYTGVRRGAKVFGVLIVHGKKVIILLYDGKSTRIKGLCGMITLYHLAALDTS